MLLTRTVGAHVALPDHVMALILATIFAANIRRYVSAEPLANVIDAARGYEAGGP